jgi:hypothetical protein
MRSDSSSNSPVLPRCCARVTTAEMLQKGRELVRQGRAERALRT